MSLSDFVRAFANVYLPGLSVTVLSSLPQTYENELGQTLRGRGVQRLLNNEDKVRIIAEWTRAEYSKTAAPLLAVGNTRSDMDMCRAASRAGGLGIMVEHDSPDECAACYYPLWGNFSSLHHHGLKVLSMNELPRPLFEELGTSKDGLAKLASL